MTQNELETLVFELAEINYKIGKIEADGKTSQKAYDKLSDKRDVMSLQLLKMFRGTITIKEVHV